MCKANGKRWKDCRESDRCQTYLDALAETSEIRMFNLIQSRQGLRPVPALSGCSGKRGRNFRPRPC